MIFFRLVNLTSLYVQAGLIEEMMEDTFESLEDDDLEEQADQEVEKILWEVTSGKKKSPKMF